MRQSHTRVTRNRRQHVVIANDIVSGRISQYLQVIRHGHWHRLGKDELCVWHSLVPNERRRRTQAVCDTTQDYTQPRTRVEIRECVGTHSKTYGIVYYFSIISIIFNISVSRYLGKGDGVCRSYPGEIVHCFVTVDMIWAEVRTRPLCVVDCL